LTLAEQICADIKAREAFGARRYGRPLHPTKDTRDWLQEAYQEQLDSLFYLKAEMKRRDALKDRK
jgi:hypothetical protein